MTRVALFFGGCSPEHEVSLVSAQFVAAQLELAGFDVVLVGIDRANTWHVGERAFEVLLKKSADTVVEEPAAGGLLPRFAETIENLAADVVFPMIHGTSGEDGYLQGYCQWLGVPFVGPGVLAVSLTWDKLATRWALLQAGLPQADYLALDRDNFQPETTIAAIEAKLTYPVFVKPARTGSSIGISKAHDRQELTAAINNAFIYDYRVIVEETLIGREVEVAALGARDPFISIAGEIIPSNAFYDFEDKYLKGATRFEVPARISESQYQRLVELAKQAWRMLDCYGMSRIDFFVTEKDVYLNEINTIPGFTEISMYPRLLAHGGINATALMRRLVELALQRSKHLARGQNFNSKSNWYRKTP